MKAFHGDQRIKDKYVQRMKDHIAADELIRGIGYKENKGCAVGCTLNDYDHKKFEDEIGPEWLAQLEDVLFEGMSLEKSKTFPLIFLESIMPGAVLDNIKIPFLLVVLDSLFDKFDHDKFPDLLISINNIKTLYANNEKDLEKFKSASRDAEAVASAYWRDECAVHSWRDEASRAASRGALSASAASWAHPDIRAVCVSASWASDSAASAAAYSAASDSEPAYRAYINAGSAGSAVAAVTSAVSSDFEAAYRACVAAYSTSKVAAADEAAIDAVYAVTAAVSEVAEAAYRADYDIANCYDVGVVGAVRAARAASADGFSTAADSARTAQCDYFADQLIELIKNCK